MSLNNLTTWKGIGSIALDLGDVILSPVPGVNTVWDSIAAGYCLLMWGGKPSIVSIVEAVIPESVAVGPGTAVGMLVPSCTIAAILAPDERRRYQ